MLNSMAACATTRARRGIFQGIEGHRRAWRLSKNSPDARMAPSLDLLRRVIKKGLPLHEMLNRIVQGVESGLWEPWLAAYGFELRGVNYSKTGARNARIALDISLAAKANAIFSNA
ncbi:hypothetical protein LP420_09850 [Massilia sp. B-10]|nr:hypothetical protein LP420_09850 [Massilia sp. B-10]UUZ57566.1 hypothetical protein LP419_09245 [Massilia sp. H-1]